MAYSSTLRTATTLRGKTLTTGPVARLLDYIALHNQRRRLARLDSAALRDMGITPDAAARESARPVWDVPSHWLR